MSRQYALAFVVLGILFAEPACSPTSIPAAIPTVLTPAPSQSTQPPGVTPAATPRLNASATATETATPYPPLRAGTNNPRDTPDYVVTVTQSGPPRWVYMVRYAGNFVDVAPAFRARTDFNELNIHATRDISQSSVAILSATGPLNATRTVTPSVAGYTLTHCSPTDIHITSKEAPNLGWDALTISIQGDYPNDVVYFGFNRACNSDPLAPSTSSYAGPVAGP